MVDIYIQYLPPTGNDVFDLKAQALVDLLRTYLSEHDTSLDSISSSLTWTEISSFSNSWENFGGDWYNAAYCKDALGFVHLRGLIKNGTWNAVAFALPAGYRPGAYTRFSVIGYNYVDAAVDVRNNGDVYIRSAAASNDWLNLDGISFFAEG